jgi:guanine deaminase
VQHVNFAILGTAFHTPRRGNVEVLEEALIGVGDDGKIASIMRPGEAPYAELKSDLARAGRLMTLKSGQYLLPGLIDLHIHAPQWPQLGKALHLRLEEWLQKHTFPLEARYADAAFAQRVYENLVGSLLANGTTTAVYFATIHNEASLVLARICQAKGQRAFIGRIAMDDPSQCPDYYRDASAEAALDGTRAFIEAVRGLPKNDAGLVKPAVTPRFIPSCTDRLLEGLGKLAAECGCHVQTHCSESDWEHGYVLKRLGRSDAAALDGFGLMTRHTVLAHSNFVSSTDMDLIRESGAGIAHCPLSNFYFSTAVFPLRAALDKGLRVGLGTDISGGPSPSIFDTCRTAVAASRALEDGVNPHLPADKRGVAGQRIDFRDAFWLATAGGADVLDVKTGQFALGYEFDAILVDANVTSSNVVLDRELDTLEDTLQKIVYNAGRANITHTWVAGKLVKAGS